VEFYKMEKINKNKVGTVLAQDVYTEARKCFPDLNIVEACKHYSDVQDKIVRYANNLEKAFVAADKRDVLLLITTAFFTDKKYEEKMFSAARVLN